ncbi:MAG TPA: secondary thiamine-phosphate synthase enzyme YjbQ [Candidatus Marinimicrobia bacterium]|nr:secondary thiamine-phosphate synthase enzyme YjbQ [Candidatus Neomarinimicrobiota bacterium]HOV24434.1 secondary thiamine-phosphate synthase enzyme YjbQ [Candidatus Neomarinimicrobiota bacterium]HPI27137.1 secondary thiamine-phosphate synthase enzyme YjbQ [Candidatus Neomarinimicrobiota bacterium]HPN73918.1 secondary thiamine-phosphate synthase enzyme YjbQ [Candidatus Neomarinimicrobiota bacterium]HQQ84604.1 secondary thiamine-phosphate synthase enzyme YjbQ [Candidatus Neomarinimicrobiota ba
MKEIILKTNRRIELIDITAQVAEAVRSSGIREGICVVYCPHTTAGLTINEHADPNVASDIVNRLSKLVPHNENYAHIEGNADAHIKSTLTGNSVQLIVNNGNLLLGVWQGIFFCEYDGPRNRRVWVQVR